jgi:hypothetical protein
MKSPAKPVIVTFVLAICLLCPLVDMFDYWDHAPQTGNDTEYTIVIVGLCVGALYTFARVILKIGESARSKETAVIDGCPTLSRASLNFIVNTLISASPPLAALRI